MALHSFEVSLALRNIDRYIHILTTLWEPTGDGEISFGGNQDVNGLMSVLQGAAVSAANNAATQGAAQPAAAAQGQVAAAPVAAQPAAAAASVEQNQVTDSSLTDQVSVYILPPASHTLGSRDEHY